MFLGYVNSLDLSTTNYATNANAAVEFLKELGLLSVTQKASVLKRLYSGERLR